MCPPAVSLLTLGRNEVTSSRPTSFFKTFFLILYTNLFPLPPFFLSLPCSDLPPPYPLLLLVVLWALLFLLFKDIFPTILYIFPKCSFPIVPVPFPFHTKEWSIYHLSYCLLQTSGADIASRVPCSVYIDAVTSLLFVLSSTYCNWAFNVTFPLSLSVSSLSPYTVDFISPLPTDCIRGYWYKFPLSLCSVLFLGILSFHPSSLIITFQFPCFPSRSKQGCDLSWILGWFST